VTSVISGCESLQKLLKPVQYDMSCSPPSDQIVLEGKSKCNGKYCEHRKAHVISYKTVIVSCSRPSLKWLGMCIVK
jgi:hypothetical protein